MFADLDQINAAPRIAALATGSRAEGRASSTGIKVSAAEAPLKEEVQHKLQHLPPALFARCQQVIFLLTIPLAAEMTHRPKWSAVAQGLKSLSLLLS